MRVSAGSLATLSLLAAPALSWGEFGHEITATIAQIHLYPSSRDAICHILPATFKCHLGGVAAWPDLIKMDPDNARFNSLHYVNGKADFPPSRCDFRDWNSPRNILSAIVNTTRQVRDENMDGLERDHALRFLVHFLGDIHQPFHLAGRATGGNDIIVKYNKRNTSIHSVWDTSFIEDMVVHLPNYTTPLPTTPESTRSAAELEHNTRIETALRGSPYDPYIRWILVEGIQNWWANEVSGWTTCPQLSGPTDGQMVLDKPAFEDPMDLPVCPYYWASQTHPLLCGSNSIWPADSSEPQEINKAEYGNRVRREKLVEKQLALGGIRLAGVLNGLFGSEEDKELYGAVPALF